MLGAVAPTQVIVEDAAKALIGHSWMTPTLAAIDAAAQARLQADHRQARHHRYRIKVAGVLARRAAAIAFDRARARRYHHALTEASRT